MEALLQEIRESRNTYSETIDKRDFAKELRDVYFPCPAYTTSCPLTIEEIEALLSIEE